MTQPEAGQVYTKNDGRYGIVIVEVDAKSVTYKFADDKNGKKYEIPLERWDVKDFTLIYPEIHQADA